MIPSEILVELERLARRLGVVVRFEAFDAKLASKGGLCRVRGEQLIVIEEALPVMDKIGILAEALSTFDLEAIYLPPILRTRLERNRSRRGRVRPPLRPMAKTRPRAVR